MHTTPPSLNRLLKKVGSSIALIATLTSATLGTAFAATPNRIIYEGRLLDGSGSPITTEQTVRFSLWSSADYVTGDVSSGTINTSASAYGNWYETQTFTPNSNGVFNLAMGASTALPSIDFRYHKYLQVEMKSSGAADTAYELLDSDTNDTTVDRQTIGTVPYAETTESLDRLAWKDNVVAATTTALTLASDVEHGDSIDSVTLATGDRVLIKDQSTASENGIYIVAASGAPTRATDLDESAEFNTALVMVSGGTTNDDSTWQQTTADPSVGTTSITFSAYGGGGGHTQNTDTGTTSTSFTVNSDATDAQLSFGNTVEGYLSYTNATDMFNIQGNVDVDGTLNADGDTTLNGNVTLGDTVTDGITITGSVQGTNALVFDGSTDDTNETTFAITDPSVDRTITFKDESGTVALISDLDAVAAGLSWKSSVAAATTTALTLASDFEHGDSIDGVTLTTGDRILIKDQASGSENGVYTVNASGAPTRSTDMDLSAEFNAAVISVEAGTSNADTSWRQTAVDPTVDTTNIVFSTFGTSTADASTTVKGIVQLSDDGEATAGEAVQGSDSRLHTQNTDSGTTSNAFVVNSDAADAQLSFGNTAAGYLTYINTTDVFNIQGNLDVDGTLNTDGNTTLNANVTLGDTSSDVITVTGRIGDDSTLTLGTDGDITLQYDEDGEDVLQITGNTTFDNNVVLDGNTTLGDAVTDGVTVTGAIQGAAALVFDGATDDTNETTLAVADPSGDNTITLPDASGKILLEGNAWKETVVAASTAAITLASDISNADVIDGVTLSTGDRVLVKDQASASENGIYIIAVGAPTRATDMDTAAEANGAIVSVLGGTANDNKIFQQTALSPVIDTDPISFTEFAGGAHSQNTDTGTDNTSFVINNDATDASLHFGNTVGGYLTYLSGTDLFNIQGNVDIDGTFNADGNTTLNGNVTLGDTNSDLITITGRIGDDSTLTLGTDGDITLQYDEDGEDVLQITGNTTFDNNVVVDGDTSIGDAVTDGVTITGAVQGTNALVFDGATDDTNETTLAITDPSGDNTITVPDATGTLLVDGMAWKDNVQAATTAAITLASEISNGDTIDGIVLATGDRVLVKDQASASENGIYVVAGGAPTRATDMDVSAEFNGAIVTVEAGTANGGKAYRQTAVDPTVETTSIAFSEFGAGSSGTRQISVPINELLILADGSNNLMNVYQEVASGDNPHAYFVLKTAEASQQDLDLKFKVLLPQDFQDFSNSTDISVDFKTTSTTTTENKIDILVEDNDGDDAFTATDGQTQASTVADTWTQYTDEFDGGSFDPAAGEYIYVTIKAYGLTTKSPYLGEIVISYTGQ